MRALVTGATGFVGRHLVAKLSRPVVLSRNAGQARAKLGDVEVYAWEPTAGPPPVEAFSGVDTVFHLAGDPIVKGRWNPAKLKRIRESRVLGTRNLVSAMESLPERPKVLICASAVGFYGNRGDEVLEEASLPGSDTLAGICQEWETEAGRATALGVRVINLRSGVVLRKGGGVLAEMLLPFQLCLGGRLGSGKQWMSWIHLDDLLGIMFHAVEKGDMRGPVNGVAPGVVTNAEFTKVLAATLRRPAIFPMPEFAIKIIFGGVSEVMLGSQRVRPLAAEKAGYKFQYPELGPALTAIISGA